MKVEIKKINADYVAGYIEEPEKLEEIRVLADNIFIEKVPAEKIETNVLPFYFTFSDENFSNPETTIIVEAKTSDDRIFSSEKKIIPTPCIFEEENKKTYPEVSLPLDIIKLLCSYKNAVYYEKKWDEELLDKAIDDIIYLAENAGQKAAAPIHRYFLFIKNMSRLFNDIYSYFPKHNKISKNPDDIDSKGILTSPEEMICIANHLYVLKSYGLSGNFLEFGCYKGFSSSCLSHACHFLGIKMDIFDSFAGLPDSNAKAYKKGDFSSSLEETGKNIETYGKIEAVDFHKGFFEETLKEYKEKPICIWQDVDLFSSAKDVMTIADRLDEKSCIFSHECSPEHFIDGRVIPLRQPYEITGAVFDAYVSMGQTPTGKYLTGNTGVFWIKDKAIPVMDYEQLYRML